MSFYLSERKGLVVYRTLVDILIFQSVL